MPLENSDWCFELLMCLVYCVYCLVHSSSYNLFAVKYTMQCVVQCSCSAVGSAVCSAVNIAVSVISAMVSVQ